MLTERPIRIPFDSFTLSAVTSELGAYVGGKVQDVRQPSEYELSIGIYAAGRESAFYLCCHPEHARCHFITKRLANPSRPPLLCATLRSRVEGGRLISVEQVRGDRMLVLTFQSAAGVHRLVGEFMGKHSNLIFVDDDDRILAASKWVGAAKSSRPILPNTKYILPPVMCAEGFAPRSPFLTKLVTASGEGILDHFAPVLSPGHGAYPVSVTSLGLPEFSRASISIALEQHFALSIPAQATEALRASLLNQLNRVLLAKDVALAELRQAEESGGRATGWQRQGELILAYGPAQAPGSADLVAWDYDGTQIVIKLDPELDFKQNATAYFDRAKKAKGRMAMVLDQIGRISAQRAEILDLLQGVREEPRLAGLEQLRESAVRRRYLNVQPIVSARKEERPFGGYRIRELAGPGGYTVLYGENSEGNDHLTLRIAKPNDLWLHVRGDTSAHVVIVTNNHPEKVQRETLVFAAKIAAQNSRAKHSSYVPVDYTLKKYVRRPKGAAAGAALYVNEKTIHVES
ncbi:MAG: NFACT family protein [Fimbriimonas sp.]|nr:NFACT family protein [Fimbriimonas sp.]